MTIGWKSGPAPPSQSSAGEQSRPEEQRPPDTQRPPGISRSLDSPQAFAEIFDRYFAEIHGYIARRLGTFVADDIAAETFLIAYRKRATFDHLEGAIRSWLYGIATRQVSRHRRDELRAYRALQRAGVSAPSDDGMTDNQRGALPADPAAVFSAQGVPPLTVHADPDSGPVDGAVLLVTVAVSAVTDPVARHVNCIPLGISARPRSRRQRPDDGAQHPGAVSACS